MSIHAMVESAINIASGIVVLLAIAAAAGALIVTRSRMVALPVLLDMLTAASLLHLAGGPTFSRAATAAVVIATRRLISWSLAGERRRMSGTARPPSPSRPSGAPSPAEQEWRQHLAARRAGSNGPRPASPPHPSA